MDFQRGEAVDVGIFIDMLFEMFNYEQKNGFGRGGGKLTLDDLKEAVEKLNEAGKRIIVLMDEFESITTNPNFDMQFFSFLRFLANNYKVAYVTSSLNDLQQMCYDKEIADSPFFNIFSNLPLRPFAPEEARDLIRVPSEREGLPLEPYSEQILNMSGYFPLYIQIACSSVFESVLEKDGGDPDWEQVEKTFVDEANPHYSFVWDRMDDTVRGNLARVASGKQIDKKFRHINEELHRLGYLRKKSNDESAIFSDLFRQFVLDRSQERRPKRSLFGSLFNRGDGRR
jgi:serine/threonine-protein kinase